MQCTPKKLTRRADRQEAVNSMGPMMREVIEHCVNKFSQMMDEGDGVIDVHDIISRTTWVSLCVCCISILSLTFVFIVLMFSDVSHSTWISLAWRVVPKHFERTGGTLEMKLSSPMDLRLFISYLNAALEFMPEAILDGRPITRLPMDRPPAASFNPSSGWYKGCCRTIGFWDHRDR